MGSGPNALRSQWYELVNGTVLLVLMFLIDSPQGFSPYLEQLEAALETMETDEIPTFVESKKEHLAAIKAVRFSVVKNFHVLIHSRLSPSSCFGTAH